ncbi:MAG: glutaminyl-peptide cyclotransferase [Candidatus Binataceae bacterium]
MTLTFSPVAGACLALAAVVSFWPASASGARAADRTPEYRVRVVHVYPHDRGAFTQGLEYRDGFLYESTGLYGRSTLRQEELETGKVVREIHLPARYFGEGITVLGGRIDQLTWKSHTAFAYAQPTFQLLRTFKYSGEGWGLANDGKEIFISDGTAQIRCLDPRTLRETRRFTVHDGARKIRFLNELEWVRGQIFANVWQTSRIARISPADGRVLGWIDASGLLAPADEAQPVDVLNGIAYDAKGNRLFLTGKLWPKLFQVELVQVKMAIR